MNMFVELLISSLMVVLTVGFHGLALLGLSRLLHALEPKARDTTLNPGLVRGAVTTALLALGLLAVSTIEVWAYAGLYLSVGAMSDLRSAVYFSTITYAAVGYSDLGMPDNWKLVGAIEGINGVLLLGWSVAFLVAKMAGPRGEGKD